MGENRADRITTISNTVGRHGLVKGTSVKGTEIAIWDHVHACTGDDCPIAVKCKVMVPEAKCGMQMEYVRHVANIVLRLEQKGMLDEVQMHKAGILLIPLYSQLFRFKIHEMNLRSPFNDLNGRQIIHPVYKAVRDTIVLIMATWKELGLGLNESGDPKEDFEKGGYYDLLLDKDTDKFSAVSRPGAETKAEKLSRERSERMKKMNSYKYRTVEEN